MRPTEDAAFRLRNGQFLTTVDYTTVNCTTATTLQFPSSIALMTHTQLNAPITHIQQIPIRHALQALDFLSLTAEYFLAFSTLLVLTILPSHSVFIFCFCSSFITHLVIAALQSLVSSLVLSFHVALFPDSCKCSLD